VVQATRKCSIEGCQNTGKLRRGWCNKHYWRWRKHGDPLKTREIQGNRPCSVESCEDLIHAKGYCRKHYAEWRVSQSSPCSIPECERKSSTRGLCKKHYNRLRSQGKLPGQDLCVIEGCDLGMSAGGLCYKHSSRLKRNGDPLKLKNYFDKEEAFNARTKKDGDCLVWTGNKAFGYGKLRHSESSGLAHRYAWIREHGEIPEGYMINHRCWNRSCVNIDHLELVTAYENNSYLSGPDSRSKTGARNVYKEGNRWRVRMRSKGIDYDFGSFKSLEEAKEAASEARKQVFGRYAGKG